LSGYNPEIINAETGSRFENNMLILDKYEEIGSIKQVILSNGEFIESSMMTGNEPVLFIGKNNVPAEVKNYIKKKGIEIGVLIGNELIGSATDIRRQLGISVFVKFARGSRVPGGTINPVEDLDRFPMPSYSLSLSIASISYNRATGQLEVSYRNNVNLATYFTTTITLFDADGASMAVVGDESPVFISGAETKTIVYSKLNIEQQRLADNVSAEIYTVYGESKTSLENAIRGRFSIEMIDVKDDTNIEIVDLVYDKTAGKFIVTIENIGKVDAFVRAEIVELWVNRVYTTAGSDEPVLVSSGKKKRIPVVIELEDEDLEHSRNSRITVRAPFGERKLALIKVKTKQFDLKIKELNLYLYAAISIMVLIILFLLLSRKRKKKKCSRCRAINETDAKLCKKCGYELN
jgi:hypothetical protein